MKLTLLALDYDGTIAEHDELDAEVRGALAKARGTDVTLVLATGRILAELQRVAHGLEVFDAVVAENGAVLHFPDTDHEILLADPLDPTLIQELMRRNIPFLAGACILELDAKHAEAALTVIRELELPLILVFNRERLMVLPEAVSKGTALRAAARVLRLSLHNAIAVGDGQNDHDMLRACEFGAAVAWGSPTLQLAADEVIQGQGPSAVAAFIDRVTAPPNIPVHHGRRAAVYVGMRPGGAPLALASRGRNILIVGDPGSGKSWLAGLLCEQVILRHYCVCVIDAEGDYTTLESLPGVIVLHAEGGRLSIDQIELTLRYPDVSLVVDLCKLPGDEKHSFVIALLKRLVALRRRTGLPHRLIIDEAHYFLQDGGSPELLDLDSGGYMLVSYRATQLSPDVIASMDAVLVTGENDASEAEALRKLVGEAWSSKDWGAALRDLEMNEAVLLPGAAESGSEIVRFRVARRLTPHVRHKHKYLATPVSESAAFVFVRNDGAMGQRAYSLSDLMVVLSAAPEHSFDSHLERGDFSRWVQDIFADSELADEIRSIETAWRAGRTDRPCAEIVRVIRSRYVAQEPRPSAANREVPPSTP